jgi:hypothetical protein
MVAIVPCRRMTGQLVTFLCKGPTKLNEAPRAFLPHCSLYFSGSAGEVVAEAHLPVHSFGISQRMSTGARLGSRFFMRCTKAVLHGVEALCRSQLAGDAFHCERDRQQAGSYKGCALACAPLQQPTGTWLFLLCRFSWVLAPDVGSTPLPRGAGRGRRSSRHNRPRRFPVLA